MITEVLNIKSLHDYTILEEQFQIITKIQSQLENGRNLADIIWEMEASRGISKKQIPAIIQTLLIEKYHYSCISFNLSATVSDWEKIHQIVKRWNRFNTVAVYYHPQLDVSLINPAVEEHWDRIESLSAYELMVLYTKSFIEEERSLEMQLLKDFKAVCNGQEIDSDAKYISDKPLQPQPAKAEPAPVKETVESKPTEDAAQTAAPTAESGKKRVTPKYGVQVTNELFHNGNVEAWRNIIESYQKKYPGNTVMLYHNGQRIKHISSLFKWGKVKTGDSIFFSLVGEEIKDVAKLKKYLYQGAGVDFKYFVKNDPNTVLKLF